MSKHFLTLRVQPLSDEEYVEQVRKGLAANRWLRGLLAFMGLAITAAAFWGATVLLDILSSLGNSPGQQNTAHLFFSIAIMFGIMVGLMFSHAISMFITALFPDDRKERLLVECWDALTEAGRAEQLEHDTHDTPESASSRHSP